MMIELLVLLGGDFRPRTGPQGRGGVDRFFLTALIEDDRQSDMVRIGLDDPPEPCRVEILILALAQMNDNLGAACSFGDRLDRELAPAVRHPAPTLAFARLAAQDLEF